MYQALRATAGLVALGLTATAAPLRAQFTLTFEGLKDQEAVESYYNGGSGSLGSTGGANHGVTFSSNALAIIRGNAGGNGNFGDEPSPNTVLYFLTGNAATLNYAAGFTTGFSFYYSAAFQPGSIGVFDGVDGTGNLLATLDLPSTPNGAVSGCSNNPGANYCPFVPIGVAFAGTARSINFGGTVNRIGFDNVTFGSVTPMPPVPEPQTVALVGAGLLALGGAAARHRRAVSAASA